MDHSSLFVGLLLLDWVLAIAIYCLCCRMPTMLCRKRRLLTYNVVRILPQSDRLNASGPLRHPRFLPHDSSPTALIWQYSARKAEALPV